MVPEHKTHNMQLAYFWKGSSKHKLFHFEGGRVHRGNHEHSNTWVTCWRVFGEMERHMYTALIV